MSLFDKDPPAAARSAESVIACFAEAKAQHHAVEQSGRQALAAARKAGKVLLKARAKTPFGQWTATVEANWPGQIRTCQVYIRIAENWSRVATAASIREALKILTEDPPEEEEDDPKYAAPAAHLPSDDEKNEGSEGEGENEDEGQPPARRKRGRVAAGPPPTAARLLVKEFDATFGPLNRLIDKVQVYFSRQERFEAVKQLLNSLLVERKKWLREVDG